MPRTIVDLSLYLDNDVVSIRGPFDRAATVSIMRGRELGHLGPSP